MSASAGTVTYPNAPCVGRLFDPSKQQINARLGETYNLTFAGTPPYNLSMSVSIVITNGSYTYCGVQQQTIDTNTYNWTVEPFIQLGYNATERSGGNKTLNLVQPGQSIMFSAVEMTSHTQNAYYTSDNYTIVLPTFSNAASVYQSSSIMSVLLLCFSLGFLCRRWAV